MRVLDIIFKDLKIMLKDKKAIGIMIIMPIILTTILGGALSGTFSQDFQKDKVKIAIIKKYDIQEEVEKFMYMLKNSSISENFESSTLKEISDSLESVNIDRILTEEFLESEEIKEIIDYSVVNEEEAVKMLESKEISAVVIFPVDFVYNMYVNFFTPFNNKVEINILNRHDDFMSSEIVASIFTGFSDILSSQIISKNVFIETALEEGLGEESYEAIEDIFKLQEEKIDNLNVNIKYIKVKGQSPITSFQYYAAAMIVMFILFTAGEGGKLLLEEKENLTYQRMVMAGISKWKIVLGKFFTIFIFGCIQAGVMILFTRIVHKVHWGNPVLVLIITICALFAVAGLGTLISALTFKSGNSKVSDVFQAAIVNVMAFLGGSFIPVNIMPEFLQRLGDLTLNGLALKAYQRVMLGKGIEEILSSLVSLIFMGMVFSVVGVYILKKEEGWRNAKYNNAKTYEIKG